MFVVQATGQTLSPDAPFTLGDVQYPANWLRVSSAADKAALGIIEVADPPPYDQRFYWGYDGDGNLIPKDVAGLKVDWTSTTRTTAGTLIAPTDWMLVRQVDTGVLVPDAIKAERQAVRDACEVKLLAIAACVTTDELAAYINSEAYAHWPGLDPV